MTIPSPRDTLTNRQNEVLNLLDISESRQAIADRLELSESRVSQIVSQLKAHFHIKGATDVRLVQVYRESIGDVPDANDPIPGEEIANDLFDWLPAPPQETDEDLPGLSVVPDRFNGPNGTLWRLAAMIAFPIAILVLLALIGGAMLLLETVAEQLEVGAGSIPAEVKRR